MQAHMYLTYIHIYIHTHTHSAALVGPSLEDAMNKTSMKFLLLTKDMGEGLS